MRRPACLLLLLLLALAVRAAAGAEVVLESPRFRAVLGEDAVWRSLVEKAGGRDLLAAGGRRVLLVFEGLPPEAARGLLEKAAFQPQE